MTLSRETKDKFATAFGKFQRGYVKRIIKDVVGPRVDDLEAAGIGKEEFEYLVKNGISFYDSVMPQNWKKGLFEAVRQYKSIFDQVKDDKAMAYLFMESLSEIREWFPKVIGKDYFESEYFKFRKDAEKIK